MSYFLDFILICEEKHVPSSKPYKPSKTKTCLGAFKVCVEQILIFQQVQLHIT